MKENHTSPSDSKRTLRTIGIIMIIVAAIGLYLTAGEKTAGSKTHNETLVVYSSRQTHLIQPLLEQFKQETGIHAVLFTGNDGQLIERIKTEATNPQADILVTVDAGNLWYAAKEGLFVPVSSDSLKQRIPSQFKDPDNQWFGFSIRSRTIIYNTDRVNPAQLSSYEALANPMWKGKLLLRTSKKVYNQSLVAMMIHALGEAETLHILKGWVANLGAPVFSNDTQVIQAIEAGQGDVGIVNTYYFGRYQKENPDTKIAIFWPTDSKIGVHANISGAGLLKNAPNPKAGVQFLEWLSTDTAQKILADSNLEYPVVSTVQPDPIVQSWGSFTPSRLPIHYAGEYQADAIRLMTAAQYD